MKETSNQSGWQWIEDDIQAGVSFSVPGVGDDCRILYDGTMRQGKNWRIACLNTGHVGFAATREDAARYLNEIGAIKYS